MIKMVMQEHGPGCRQERDFWGTPWKCEIDKALLFQLNYEFYVIVYPSCQRGYSHHLDFKEEFINAGCKVNSLSETTRLKLRKAISGKLADILIQNPITEINYIYENVHTEFCFCREVKFPEFIIASEGYYGRYKSTIEEIKADPVLNHLNLEAQVDKIFMNNNHDIALADEYEIVQINNSLIKKILENGNADYTKKPFRTHSIGYDQAGQQ